MNAKRYFMRVVFGLLSCLLATATAFAGPGNNRLSAWWHAGIGASGTALVALETEGLWKTTDSGATWSSVGQPTLGGYVNAVYFSNAHPNAVCAAADGVPYVSLDGGATWNLNSTLASAGYVNWLSGANSDASLRLAVVNRNKVYQAVVTLSADGSSIAAMDTSDITTGLPANIVINGPVRVNSVGDMFLPTNQGVYKRVKNAQTWSGVTSAWTAINGGFDNADMNVGDVRPWSNGGVSLLIAITDRNVWSNNGAGWVKGNGNLPAVPNKLWTTTDATYNGVYVTIPGFGIYRTTDGTTWTAFQQQVANETIGNMAIVGANGGTAKVIAATARGLYVASDANSAWQPAGGFTPNNGCSDPSLMTTLQTAMDYFSASNFTEIGNFVHANYLDDGMANSGLMDEIRQFRASAPTNIAMKLLNPTCKISANGTRAVVTNGERVYGRGNNETGPLYVMEDGTGSWSMIKENGVWKAYGNRLPFNAWVNAGVSVRPDGSIDPYPWVSFGIRDEASPTQFTAVTVSGPGVNGSPAQLTYSAERKQWESWLPNVQGANAQFSNTTDPTNAGANPLAYTLAVTPRTGLPYSVTETLKGPFMAQAVKLVAPQTVNGHQLQVRGLMPSGANYRYGFELDGPQGNRIASSYEHALPQWTSAFPQPPATGTYWLQSSVRNYVDGAIEYMAMRRDSICFDGAKWLMGPCQGGTGGTTTTTTTSTTTTSAMGTTTTTSSTTSTTLPGQATTSFIPGWNLVGNGTEGSVDVAAVFGDTTKVTTVWKWLPSSSRWAFYAPSLVGQALIDYAAGKGYDVLSTVASGEGFWVNAKSNFTVQPPGAASLNSTVFQDPLVGTGRLLKGWNLIATGDNKTASEFNKALSASPPGPGEIPTNVTTLWAWKASSAQWYFYAPSLDANNTLSSYVSGKGYLEFGSTLLTPTTGFWVNKP